MNSCLSGTEMYVLNLFSMLLVKSKTILGDCTMGYASYYSSRSCLGMPFAALDSSSLPC